MTQRLIYIGHGKYGTGDLQWEAIMLCCLLGIMLFAAMNPFVYDPAKAGGAVESTIETGKSLAEGGQQDGGGGGGTGPQGGKGPTQPSTVGSSDPHGGTGSGSHDSHTLSAMHVEARSAEAGHEPPGEPGHTSSDPSKDKGGPEGNKSPDVQPPPGGGKGGGHAGGGGEGGEGGESESGGDSHEPAVAPPPLHAGGTAAGARTGPGSGTGPGGELAAAHNMSAHAQPNDAPPVPLTGGEKPSVASNPNADKGSASAEMTAQTGGGAGAGGGSGSGGAPTNVNIQIASANTGGGAGQGAQQPPPPPDIPEPPRMNDTENA